MKVQRILEITRRDATERVPVSSAIEMFSLLHDGQVNRVEMVWDLVLGEKRMTFKAHDLRDRLPGGKTSVLASGTNGPLR